MRRTLLTLSLVGILGIVPAAIAQADVAVTTRSEASRIAAQVKAHAATLAVSTTGFAASPSWVFNGTPVTLTADVQSGDGGPAPTGTVTFYAAGFNAGTVALVNGTASVTVPTRGVPGSTYQLWAVYNGDTNYACSTSAKVPVTVSSESNSTSDMAASPSSLLPGGIVTFATDVSPNQGGAIPTGIVKFYEIHGTYLGEATLVWGVATLNVNTTGVAPGTYQIYSVYQGDSIYEPSTSETDTVVIQ